MVTILHISSMDVWCGRWILSDRFGGGVLPFDVDDGSRTRAAR